MKKNKQKIKPEDLLGQIFKVQIPISGAGGALFYNKERSITFEYAVEDVTEFIDNKFKKFCSFHYNGDDVLLKEEPFQNW